MQKSSTFQGLCSVSKHFSRQILFSRTFQVCPAFSSTFQACANPGHKNVNLNFLIKIQQLDFFSIKLLMI